MPINVTCSNCNATLRAPDTAAGKKIKCPKCSTILDVPIEDVPAVSAVSAEAPAPVASAAPSRRREVDDDDRPSRRRDEDDDDEYRPRRRRGPRRDLQEQQPGTGWQLGLGITSAVLGALALCFSFIPCCGLPFALGLGGVGLIVGGVGTIIAFMAERRGLALPLIGAGVNVLAVLIAVAVYLIAYYWLSNQAAEANKQVQQAGNQWAEQVRRQEEAERKRQEELKKQKDKKDGDAFEPQFPVWKAQSSNNLRQIAFAMHAYHDANQRFPEPFPTPGKVKKGQLSWRVAILPFIGEQGLYSQFKLDENWNSPNNMKLLSKMPKVFASPRGKPGEENKTYYQVITGPKTVFDGVPPYQLFKISDGTSDTFLVVEAKDPVDWTRPMDVGFDGANVPQLGGIFNGSFHAAMADGSVIYLTRGRLRDDTLKALITARGGEVINENFRD
jgi:hypothetical protein